MPFHFTNGGLSFFWMLNFVCVNGLNTVIFCNK